MAEATFSPDTQAPARRVRALTGVQPSGELHLGNYLGAVRNWVAMCRSHEMFTCIVDYHALTSPLEPEQLAEQTFEMALAILAAGFDKDEGTLFVQSQVPEVTELTWILVTLTPMGELERMTQFKDKASRQASVLSGLFVYPVLQAADILIYQAQAVPVGEDQVQHVELTREIARKFNLAFGETFPEPEAVVPTLGGRIRGLDGKAKMSKSLGNTISLLEPPEQAWEKLRTAVTDPARLRRSDPGDPNKCSIFTLHQNFSPQATTQMIDTECRRAGIGCVDCKKLLFSHLDAELAPMRERAAGLRAQPEQVRDILERGAERARKAAQATMAEVRDKVGFYRP